MQPKGSNVNIWALPADVRQRLFDEEQRRKAMPQQTFSAETPAQLQKNKQPNLNFAQKALPTVTSVLGGVLGGVVGGPVGAVVGAGAGGAIGKGLVEVTDEKKGVNAGAIATEGAYGVAGGALGLITGKILGMTAKPVLRKAGESAMRKFAANILQASPSKTRQIAEEVADPQILLQKWMPRIGGPNEATGGLKAFKGNMLTPLKKELSLKEDIITKAIAQADKNGIKFSADDFIASLQAKRADLARLPTNATRVKELDKIIASTKKLYKNGLSASDLLRIKRTADAKWGKAVVETEKGAMSTQVEREFANIARAKLKRTFGDVGSALDEESELLALEGLFKDAVSKGASKGFGELSVNPLSWVQKAANSQKAAGAAYGETPRGIRGAGNLSKGALQQTAPRLYGAMTNKKVEEVQAEDDQEQVLGDTMGRIANELDQAIIQSEQAGKLQAEVNPTVDIGTGRALSLDDVNAMLDMDILYNDGKNLTELMKYKEDLQGAKEVQKKGVTQAQRETLGSSGIRALNQLEVLLKNDPSIVSKQLVPGKFFSRQYDAAAFRIADAVLRLRTGAAAPDREIRRYMTKIVPQFGDDEETIKFKLEQARIDFEEAMSQEGVVGEQDLLQGLLNY